MRGMKFDNSQMKEDMFSHSLDQEQETDRKSDATTLKDGGKGSSDKRLSGSKDKIPKRKRSKKKSKNYYFVHSPPHSHNGALSQNLLNLIPEISRANIKKSKGIGPNRNLHKVFDSVQKTSQSMMDKNITLHKKNKGSFSSVQEDMLPSKCNQPLDDDDYDNEHMRSHEINYNGPNIINIQQRTQEYEEEIEKLRETIRKSHSKETNLISRIKLLETENSRMKREFEEVISIVRKN
jgi:hypothetical protein